MTTNDTKNIGKTMKIRVELKTTNSYTEKSAFVDGQPASLPAISRATTGSIDEFGLGIFSSGDIRYTRLDGTQKTFAQGTGLLELTPEIIDKRIAAVREWVTENDGAVVLEFGAENAILGNEP